MSVHVKLSERMSSFVHRNEASRLAGHAAQIVDLWLPEVERLETIISDQADHIESLQEENEAIITDASVTKCSCPDPEIVDREAELMIAELSGTVDTFRWVVSTLLGCDDPE